MESFPRERTHAPSEARSRSVERPLSCVTLTDMHGLMRAQMLLAKAAFPESANSLEQWVEESGNGDSLASRFRAYVEEAARTGGDIHINIADPREMEELLQAIRAHAPETIH